MSYDPNGTSKLLVCLLIHGSPSLYKRDFLVWKIVSLSFDFIVICCLANAKASISKLSLMEGYKSFMSNIINLCELLLSIFLNQLITLAVFFNSFTFKISHSLEFIWSKICLLIFPISFLAGLMSLVVGWFKKFALWSLKVIQQLAGPFTSALSSILPP